MKCLMQLLAEKIFSFFFYLATFINREKLPEVLNEYQENNQLRKKKQHKVWKINSKIQTIS